MNMVSTDSKEKREIVETLKQEIAMIRDGGYNPPSGHPQIVSRVLRDSITCPNVTLPDDRKEVPCEQCMLHRFLPQHHPQRDMACYDIPLNQNGETLAQLEKQADPEKMQAALLSWLYRTVARLEREINLESTANEAARTFSSYSAARHG